jgi:hypothetical protein
VLNLYHPQLRLRCMGDSKGFRCELVRHVNAVFNEDMPVIYESWKSILSSVCHHSYCEFPSAVQPRFPAHLLGKIFPVHHHAKRHQALPNVAAPPLLANPAPLAQPALRRGHALVPRKPRSTREHPDPLLDPQQNLQRLVALAPTPTLVPEPHALVLLAL